MSRTRIGRWKSRNPQAPPSSPLLGFTQTDPLGPVVNGLDPATRTAVVDALSAVGYPVANIPFEYGDPNSMRALLITATRMFDEVIGRNLRDAAFADAIGPYIHRDVSFVQHDAPDWLWDLCDWWVDQRQGHCIPQTIYGEWQPDGEACDCRTDGPWSTLCGSFTADAQGKIKFWIPWPPPRGTSIELSVGVGAQINICVCMWKRTCTAESTVRTVMQVNRDCSKSTTTEHAGPMTFTSYDWEFAYPAEQCQFSARPAKMPPNDQECGLVNP